MRTPCPGSSCLVGFLLAGCSAASYSADADREVAAILAEGHDRVLGNRAEWVMRPPPPPETEKPATEKPATEKPAGEAPGAEPTAPPSPDPQSPTEQPPTETSQPAEQKPPAAAEVPVQGVEVFDLEKSLRTAVAGNREFLARREGLYQQGLAYSFTRFQFGPQWNAAVSYVWNGSENGADSHGASAQLGVSQLLPTGGTLSLASGINGAFPTGLADDQYSTSVGASLRQPLLRGAGYDISHEALTQSERSLVYAIRDFELFRENFSIQVARTFFDLVRQRQQLRNQDQNYESAVFDRKKAEAMEQVGRNTLQEVFRARRREVDAKDQLINARADYDRALDAFKIQLGLATTTQIDVAESEPPFERVRITEQDAVAAARHNRLDILSEQQQLEDSERALHIAENGLLPELDLTASYGLAGADTSLGGAGPKNWDASVGVQFTIPLQQQAQRNAYRSAQIGLEQARRNHALRLDQLDLDIRDALRRLQSVEERIDLQHEQIDQERAAVTVTQIRYESGKLDNRDLLEARQAFVNAQNELIGLKVEHFVGRLGLLRDMGLFFVDDSGQWSREGKP